jgi:hypothetical protein
VPAPLISPCLGIGLSLAERIESCDGAREAPPLPSLFIATPPGVGVDAFEEAPTLRICSRTLSIWRW